MTNIDEIIHELRSSTDPEAELFIISLIREQIEKDRRKIIKKISKELNYDVSEIINNMEIKLTD